MSPPPLMATAPQPARDALAQRWLADYRAQAGPADMMAASTDRAWDIMLDELASVAPDLGQARERVRRHAAAIGLGLPAAGETGPRPWPLSPAPLLLSAAEWAGIAAGVEQRAELLEAVLADLYGPQRLVAQGRLPAALVAGSPHFLRAAVGLTPPGGRRLQFVAFDLARGPDGEWRVLADHLRAPAGAGHALENRLAIAGTLGGLQQRLNIQRHAPFFAALRAGLAALCRRAEPRLGILFAGQDSPSPGEQAHLARYLGLLLVEGADLAALDGKLYVRTIAGLKRIDGLWRRMDARALDPLAFDSSSRIGVPGLVDAWAAGNVVLANAPGAEMLEARAWAAFLPGLAPDLTGGPLKLPNIATWWCGQDREQAAVASALDQRLIAPAFGGAPLGLPGGEPVTGAELSAAAREALLADLARRPQDYVGQELVQLSTAPVVVEDRLVPLPLTLRVFAACGADGAWTVLPGGLARLGARENGGGADARAIAMAEGAWSADVAVHGPDPGPPVSSPPRADTLHVRRNPGTLPSRVADDFFWLGRYLERGEALLGAVRLLLGLSIEADSAALAPATLERLVGLIVGAGAAAHPPELSDAALAALARTALDGEGCQSVATIDAEACTIGRRVRDRLSGDILHLLGAPMPQQPGAVDRTGSLQRRYAALSGLAAEHMVRTDSWRFLDLGRRIERGIAAARAARLFGMADASADDLSTLLDLVDSRITYRQRYPTGLARVPALDLVALDPNNPRALAFQLRTIEARLSELPVLSDDGLAEPQQAQAAALAATVATRTAATLDADTLGEVERGLAALSDAIARRYFLHGAEPLRAGGLTLA